MKKCTLALMVALLPLMAFSQQLLEYVTPVGANGFDVGVGIVVDDDANVIHCGTFSNTVDFSSGAANGVLTTNGNTDGYIQKTNAYGDFLWAVSFGGDLADAARDVDVDGQGNVYVTGVYLDTLYAGDTTLVTNGVEDIFLLKYSPTGEFIWAQSFGGIGLDDIQSISVHPVHGVHLCGGFRFTVDFDNGPGVTELTFLQNIDAFVLKLDLDGVFQWVVPAAGTSAETGEGVGVDDDGSVVSTGNFRTPVDFDPGPAVFELNGQGNDIYMQKLDVNGDFVWAKKLGQNSEDLVRELTMDSQGNLLLCGEFKSTFDFDPGPDSFILTSNGVTDIFMCKYTPDGEFIWADHIGGASNDAAYGITADDTGRFYVTGFYTGTADIEPGPGENVVSTANTSRDMLVFSFEPDGTLIESMRIRSNQDVYGYAVDGDEDGQIYLTGRFQGQVDFDPTAAIFNVQDIGAGPDSYVLKLSECPTKRDFPIVSTCEPYDFNGEVLEVSGNYEFFTLTTNGCDSIVYLDLTVNEATMAQITVESCGDLILNGDTLPSPGIYEQTLINAGGCDSLLTIEVTIPVDSTMIAANACKEFEFGSDTLMFSGTYRDTLINVLGCDSIIILDLVIEGDSIHPVDVISCGEYVYGDSTYLASALISDTLMSALGCDSIIDLSLTIVGDSIYDQSLTACFSYQFGDTLIFDSGTYMDTLVSAFGCDSIILLDLQIDTVAIDLILDEPMLSASPLADSWQWLDCLNGDEEILGETNSDFIASYDSEFSVIITQNGCVDTTDCVAIDVDGLADLGLSSFYFFPNPAADIVYLQMDRTQDLRVVVYDEQGRPLISEQNATEVDVSTLPNGVYMLSLESQKARHVERFVITR